MLHHVDASNLGELLNKAIFEQQNILATAGELVCADNELC
jgi:hypothetical protein